ncbi:hypothetical protein NDU88_001031 [Pleurodeles waltl]|uniref:Uncharacterized protein n=1 Tax=Pleurodeles waltl TaxID=8319 RepID=A0AAV7TGP9_PLEWA|nr:hypothetical protein NDU88_001031 [Pleurodeles waltl]
MVDLERGAWQPDGEELQRKLALLCAELRQASLAEARQCWQATTQRVYELGDKTGKLLFWLATCDVSAWVVPLIRDRIGTIQEDLLAIVHNFASYYEDLYAPVPQPLAEQENPIPLPSIPTSLAADLDRPLTEEEVGMSSPLFNLGKPQAPMGILSNTTRDSACTWCLSW